MVFTVSNPTTLYDEFWPAARVFVPVAYALTICGRMTDRVRAIAACTVVAGFVIVGVNVTALAVFAATATATATLVPDTFAVNAVVPDELMLYPGSMICNTPAIPNEGTPEIVKFTSYRYAPLPAW
jgi:hypothetical protein